MISSAIWDKSAGVIFLKANNGEQSYDSHKRYNRYEACVQASPISFASREQRK